MNKPEINEQEPEQNHSRRLFFRWVGQVVGGASLAGIGLGITNPLNALASSRRCMIQSISLDLQTLNAFSVQHIVR